MPLIDLPLEQLREYQGINPRPTDFDAYWQTALAEMHAVDPRIELIPAAFQAPFAECFDLYFTGVRGARIHAKYLRPKNTPQPHPAILQFHGYTSNSGEWSEKLHWVASGFSVAALDCRGQGGLSEDVGGVPGNTLQGHIIRGLDGKPEDLLFRQVYLDVAQLAGIILNMPDVDPTRVGAWGNSQGGALTLVCGALEPRIQRLAPIHPFLCDFQRVWEMDLANDAFEDLRIYFRRFDPLHQREKEIFTRLGYIDCQYLVPRIQGEVMMAIGLMDEVCPPSTQFAAYNKITATKQAVIYPDFAHEYYPGHPDRIYQFLLGL
jgi:cephalosporin-C deacetylase